MKMIQSPPGTNPMDSPELVKRQRVKRWQLIGLILGGILGLGIVCGLPMFFLTRPKPATAAKNPTATLTATASPTAAFTATQGPTNTPWPTMSPSATLEALGTPWINTPTISASPSPIVITREVTRVVQGQGQPYPVPVITLRVEHVEVPILQTVIVTTTPPAPPPTQTPWIVEVTREVTREVTPTFTLTPTATETPTETPTIQAP